MKNFLKLLLISFLLFFNACTKTDEEKVPEKIIMLFVTQPQCPSCEALQKTMELPKPKALLSKYFELKMVNLGEEMPKDLLRTNGTPTVYFLGAKNKPLLEPMVGEKSEERLLEFLEDALLEFKNTYKVDLTQVEVTKNEKNVH